MNCSTIPESESCGHANSKKDALLREKGVIVEME
jgi:hypothetical protein